MSHRKPIDVTSSFAQALQQIQQKPLTGTRPYSTKRLAVIIDTAIHEAGHAVAAVALGGGFCGLELHLTKKEREAENDSDGSCGILVYPPFDYAVAAVAGPIAASKLTGFCRKSSDYPNAECELKRIGRPLEEAERKAYEVIEGYWNSIERIAAVLLTTRFGPEGRHGYRTNDLRHLITPDGGCVNLTIALIPDAVKVAWKERKEAGRLQNRLAKDV